MNNDTTLAFFMLVVVGIPALFSWFLVASIPTMVAVIKRATHMRGIMLVNTLLWWTLVGWLAALVWAIVDEGEHGTPDTHTKS